MLSDIVIQYLLKPHFSIGKQGTKSSVLIILKIDLYLEFVQSEFVVVFGEAKVYANTTLLSLIKVDDKMLAIAAPLECPVIQYMVLSDSMCSFTYKSA